MRTGLYRFYDNSDVLLYVGISKNPFTRLGQHVAARGDSMEDVCRTTIEWFNTRKRALSAEGRAIKREGPMWNIRHKPKPKKRRPRKAQGVALDAQPSSRSRKAATYWNVGPHLPPSFGPPVPNYVIELAENSDISGMTEFVFTANEHGLAMAAKVARCGSVILAQPSVNLPQDFIDEITSREIYFYEVSAAQFIEEMHKADKKAPVIKRPSSFYNWRKKDFIGLDRAIGNEGKE